MSNSFSIPPSKVRGHAYRGWLGTTEFDPQDVVNVEGQGILHMMSLQLAVGTDSIDFIIRLDDLAFILAFFTGDVDSHPVILLPLANVFNPSIQAINETDVRNKLLNLEFDTSLQVQISRSAGSGGQVFGEVYYSLISP